MITISETAAKYISTLAEKQEKPGAKLRVAVNGGGCSGFSYDYKFPIWENAENDSEYEFHGATVIIDDKSLDFLKGCTIDYVEELGGGYINIINPNATARCGCGNSFSTL